jgi:hypothetical protein
MGSDGKATLRKVLEEDTNSRFVELTDDQIGSLVRNYPMIRKKYGFHESNPIYFIVDHQLLLLADSHRIFSRPETN